ncbi:MAG: Gfo/Idh/MocA family oxidoreductase [Acidobacteriota bacterium]|nr:MAG: Gfo/Idh/MocA family oxidoreductase [Acidobacteriota bacterium]
MKKTIGRRDFLKTSSIAALAGAPAVGIARAGNGTVAPSDQVTLGVIGMGRQGMYNMEVFLGHPECRVAAVCDVYKPHLDRAVEETKAQAYTDFRQILERQDIDAVVISTPDHWHPLMAVQACQAGKDVYVEKPISIAVAEGRAMVEAARRHGRIVQVGTQQRSGTHFQKAVQLVRAGELGRVTSVRTWNFGNSFPNGIGNPPDSDPPEGLDWDLWLGPAPKVPFNLNRFGVGDRWSTFRYFWDYAGGMMTDWGVHLLDIVQWAMDVDAPQNVSASGAKFVLQDNRETPDTLTVTYEYPEFICTYENRDCNSYGVNGHGYGIEFYGTKGTMFLDRSGFEVIPQTRREEERRIPLMYAMQQSQSNHSNHDHTRDFLDCMKSRKEPISDIEIGHRSTTTCLLANISYLTGRRLVWDREKEQIVGDEEANKMLARRYRNPWSL